MNIKFDTNETMSYGHYECPKCGSIFYAGGAPIHRERCALRKSGYEPLTFVIGQECLDNAKYMEEHGHAPALIPFTYSELMEAIK